MHNGRGIHPTKLVRIMKERSYIMEAIDLLVNDAKPMKKPYTAPRWLDFLATGVFLVAYALAVLWIVCKLIDLF